MSTTITFQHLDTDNNKSPSGFPADEIFLFGRSISGKSVAAKISGIRPHFCIEAPPHETPALFIKELKEKVWKLKHSESIVRKMRDRTEERVKNIREIGDPPHDFIDYEVVNGQDIVRYLEKGTRTFLRIRCFSKSVCRLAKKYLTKGEITLVESQYYVLKGVTSSVTSDFPSL